MLSRTRKTRYRYSSSSIFLFLYIFLIGTPTALTFHFQFNASILFPSYRTYLAAVLPGGMVENRRRKVLFFLAATQWWHWGYIDRRKCGNLRGFSSTDAWRGNPVCDIWIHQIGTMRFIPRVCLYFVLFHLDLEAPSFGSPWKRRRTLRAGLPHIARAPSTISKRVW